MKRLCKMTMTATMAIIAFAFMAGSAIAMPPGSGGDGMVKDEAKTSTMMKAKMLEYKIEDFEMTKALMEIIRDLSHKPSKADKKKLDEMITRLDEKIDRKEQMLKDMDSKMLNDMRKRDGKRDGMNYSN